MFGNIKYKIVVLTYETKFFVKSEYIFFFFYAGVFWWMSKIVLLDMNPSITVSVPSHSY